MKQFILEDVINELNAVYNTDFLRSLLAIPHAGVFLFGGAVRDMILGKKWKEADMRVVVKGDWKEREHLVEKALSSYNVAKERIEAANLTVYRFLPPGSSTDHAVDLSLVPSLADNMPDFTINSLFIDLRTGELIDRYSGMSDLERRVLRTVRDPGKQFVDEPHMMFRAIKCVCQFDLVMDDTTYQAIVQNAQGVSQTFDFIEKERKGILVELFLANIFRGLNYNPEKYITLVSQTGILDAWVNHFANKFGKNAHHVTVSKSNIFAEPVPELLEERVARLLSFIAQKITAADPQDVFESIKRLMSLDRAMEYKDFEVDTAKIAYLAN